MASINPYFIIGTLGMVLTSLIHFIVIVLTDVIDQAFFYILYLIFGLMLLFGSDKTRKLERVRVRRK